MAIDLLNYILVLDNKVRALHYRTETGATGLEHNQTQRDGAGHFYHTKGAPGQPCKWERFHLARHNGIEHIWRTVDTSEAEDRMYWLNDGKGAPWLPRFVDVGKAYPFFANLQHFDKADGDKLNSGQHSYTITVKELRQPYMSPSGVTLPSAVVLQVGDFDTITYAGGLVEFKNRIGFHSYVVDPDVQPPPVLQRETIGWLTLPPIDTPAPRPTETLRITTPAGGLNFRLSPGLNGTRIATIANGEMIERFTDVIPRRVDNLDWYNIRRQGVDGWVAKVQGVEFTNPASRFARLRGLWLEMGAELDRLEAGTD